MCVCVCLCVCEEACEENDSLSLPLASARSLSPMLGPCFSLCLSVSHTQTHAHLPGALVRVQVSILKNEFHQGLFARIEGSQAPRSTSSIRVRSSQHEFDQGHHVLSHGRHSVALFAHIQGSHQGLLAHMAWHSTHAPSQCLSPHPPSAISLPLPPCPSLSLSLPLSLPLSLSLCLTTASGQSAVSKPAPKKETTEKI